MSLFVKSGVLHPTQTYNWRNAELILPPPPIVLTFVCWPIKFIELLLKTRLLSWAMMFLENCGRSDNYSVKSAFFFMSTWLVLPCRCGSLFFWWLTVME